MRRLWFLFVVLLCAFAGVSVPVAASATSTTASVRAVAANQIPVPRPVMGWASWNSFAAVIDYNVIKQQVDAFVAAGLPQAGYEYINLDEGWWQGTRDSAGNITVDTSEWPGGMSAIADYIHSKGLKAGIYTDAGKDGCGYYYPTGRPAAPGSGSEGHYEQDMLQFQRWGFDMVKVDWCGGQAEGLDPQTTYQAISDAVANATAITGRPMVLSICNWGERNPWNWGPGMAPMWRTSTDIIYWGQTASMPAMLANFDKGLHPTAQHTGYVNDPDMLTLGMNGLTAAQNRTHLNLWAISGAPLLAGNNMATMSATTAAIMKNTEVIAVDQDPRGLQGVKVAEDSAGLQVYGKVLSGTGRRAVVLLNRTSSAANMTVRWSDLGLTTASASVRNLWTASNVGNFATGYSVNVPAGDSVMLTVTGTESAATTYTPTSSGSFNNVNAGATGLATATIAYTNGGATTRTAKLQVNGQVPTTVAFPPTGSSAGTVTVQVSLAKGTANTLSFTSPPGLQAMEIQPIPGTNGTELIGVQSNRCADIYNNTITNGTQAALWDCTGGRNQTWTYTAGRQLVVYGNKCLDANNNGTTNGTAVIIWDCNGQTNQQWNINSNGTISGVQSGLCLDASGNGTANGTKLILWSCSAAANQRWTRN